MASSSSNDSAGERHVPSDSLHLCNIFDSVSDGNSERSLKRIKVDEKFLEKRKVARDYHFVLRPLQIYTSEYLTTACHCYECDHELFSTFHLAYYMYFGLQFSSVRDTDKSFHISGSVIAQAICIYEQRVKKCSRLFSLQDICVFNIVSSYSHCLDKINFPEKLRRHIDRFVGGFDIVDNVMSKKVGNTIFRPWAFPKFLFRHRDNFIGNFDKRQFQLSSKYDLDKSDKILK